MRRRLRIAWLFFLILAVLPLGSLAEEVEPWSREHPEILYNQHLHSEAAILVDGDTGEVLFSKNSSVRMYPASTTKIMTLLLALESDIGLDEMITIPSAAGDIPEGSSVVPVLPGEEMPFRDLLYGFMMRSGNDGANAIAVLVSGSISAFVDQMNARAAALGLTDTHFVNAHGYHNTDHYTTAADLAVIAREAMQNADFRTIVATPRYNMQATSRRGELEIVTRNELIIPDSTYYYADCVGIKTGFHSRAGQCLVGAAVRDGKLLISVALNSDGDNENLKWYDTARLFEYGYTRYTQTTVASLLETLPDGTFSARVQNASREDPWNGEVLLRVQDITLPDAKVLVLNRDGAAAEEMERLLNAADVSVSQDATAPVSAGQALGTLALSLPSGESVTASLVANRDVQAQPIETEAPVVSEQPTDAPAVSSSVRQTGSPGRTLQLVLIILAAASGTITVALAASEIRYQIRLRRRRAKRKKKKRA